MGLFDRLLLNEYDVAAKRICERTLSHTLTPADEDMVALLGVRDASFIRERVYLRCNVSKSMLMWLQRKSKRDEVDLAYIKLDKRLLAHFVATLGSEGEGQYLRVGDRYMVEEAPQVAAKFHFHAGEGNSTPLSDDPLYRFVDWTQQELKAHMMFVGDACVRLK